MTMGLLALPFAGMTVLVGWWGVPIVAALWGILVEPEELRPARVASAAAAGWMLLLLWASTRGPVWELATTLGSIMSVTGPGVIIVTALFPALLAWSVAGVAREVRAVIA